MKNSVMFLGNNDSLIIMSFTIYKYKLLKNLFIIIYHSILHNPNICIILVIVFFFFFVLCYYKNDLIYICILDSPSIFFMSFKFILGFAGK